MTAAELPPRLLLALKDCASFDGRPTPYVWKPASMAKLEKLGLVWATGKQWYGSDVWEITDAGRALLLADRAARGEGAARE